MSQHRDFPHDGKDPSRHLACGRTLNSHHDCQPLHCPPLHCLMGSFCISHGIKLKVSFQAMRSKMLDLAREGTFNFCMVQAILAVKVGWGIDPTPDPYLVSDGLTSRRCWPLLCSAACARHGPSHPAMIQETHHGQFST